MPELPGDDLQRVWQNQPTETPAMTSRLLESKARALRAKTRRQLLGTAAGPLASAFLYVFAIKEFPSLANILHPLYIAALVWSVGGLYFVGRGMWSTTMPADAGLTTGLEFCREEIDRRRRLVRRLLFWSLGPILLAIATFILALALIVTRDRGIFPNGLPFLALVVVWIFAYFVLRLREQRELERELEELNQIERA
jgi:hypothetical protein